jgi:uncharacterized protein YjeT (DUF2065 family)
MIPFVNPALFRRAVSKIAQLGDNNLRTTGLTVMVIGLVMMYVVRQ